MTTAAPRSPRELDAGALEAARAADRSGPSISERLNAVTARPATVEGNPPGIHRKDCDEDALAAAIEGLSRRIRAMDEHSYFVLTDLHERLDEIARRAGAVAGAKRLGIDSSLTGVAAIIKKLSRDIDDADETARTTVEGMHSGGREATRAGSINGIAEAFRRLEEQLSGISEPTPSTPDRMSPVSLDAIRRRLETLLAAPDTSTGAGRDADRYAPECHVGETRSRRSERADEETSTAAVQIAEDRRPIDGQTDLGALIQGQRLISESLDALRDGMAALADRLAALFDPLGAAPDHGADRLSAVECELAAIRGAFERAGSPAFAARLESQLAELTRRLPAASTPDRFAPALKDLEERVARLASELQRAAPRKVNRPDLVALRELARSTAHGPRGETIDRKADFIAAARRAAQAAAGAAASRNADDAGDGKPGTFARIGQAIRNRRRALLVAAAALALTLPEVRMFAVGGVATMDERSEAALSLAISDNGERDRPGGPDEIVAPSTEPKVLNAAPLAEEPPRHDPGVFAFAAPGPPYARFGDRPSVPPIQAFVRLPDRRRLPPLADAIGPAELRKAAAAGNPNAAVEVAARYAEGRLVRRDLAKAAQWYELAAAQGIAVAQYQLASLYERGQGVAKDAAAAATWYRRAAGQGNTGAMHNLAVMMSAGVEGVPDYKAAVEWFHAAADRGVEDSQYNLGVIYARGLGLDRNLVESYKWFALAAANGDPEAGAHRDAVGGALSPDDLATARAAADAWRPEPTLARANAVSPVPPAWSDPTVGITEANRRALVMKIQTALAEQGYDPGPTDGFEGPRTRQAVRAFQRKIGMTETGTISSDLLAALDPSG